MDVASSKIDVWNGYKHKKSLQAYWRIGLKIKFIPKNINAHWFHVPTIISMYACRSFKFFPIYVQYKMCSYTHSYTVKLLNAGNPQCWKLLKVGIFYIYFILFYYFLYGKIVQWFSNFVPRAGILLNAGKNGWSCGFPALRSFTVVGNKLFPDTTILFCIPNRLRKCIDFSL